MKYAIAFTEDGVRLFSKMLRDPISVVKYKGYHCLLTLTDKIVIKSIHSVSNLVVTEQINWGSITWKLFVFLKSFSVSQTFN